MSLYTKNVKFTTQQSKYFNDMIFVGIFAIELPAFIHVFDLVECFMYIFEQFEYLMCKYIIYHNACTH